MRCNNCGSNNFFMEDKKDSFSFGKAIIGSSLFGTVGAVAGINGKKSSYYHCRDCGAVLSDFMDPSVENKIFEAYLHKDVETLNFYKKIYKNIEYDFKDSSEDVSKDSNAVIFQHSSNIEKKEYLIELIDENKFIPEAIENDKYGKNKICRFIITNLKNNNCNIHYNKLKDMIVDEFYCSNMLASAIINNLIKQEVIQKKEI